VISFSTYNHHDHQSSHDHGRNAVLPLWLTSLWRNLDGSRCGRLPDPAGALI
jgi:hypothetical protein